MNISARPYQAKALDAIYQDLQVMQEVLLVAIMGAGKTFMSVRLIQRLHKENPEMRFLILAHKRELISQFQKAFEQFTDIHFRHIGVCCSGLKNKQLDRQITIASIQTFVNLKEKYLGAGLIVIDECHRVNINGDTQYNQAFEYLRLQRPNCRILGISATPFRLGLGYCYGDKIKPGTKNLFPKLNYRVTYKELRDAGYLVPLKGIVAAHDSMEQDLAGVSVNGDYTINELSEIVCREIHLQTAVEAINKYCQGYDCICVVCVNIDHAEKLLALLGDDATIVHSQLSEIDRAGNMMAWESGRKRIMVSVEILLEGYDLPRLKAIVFLRPTLSAALYLQTVGRVLRTCDGKDHGLFIDCTDSTSRFGTDLDDVKVTVPKAVEAAEKIERDMFKLCPNCEIEVHRALRECPECGFEWPENECVIAEALPDMQEVSFSEPVEPDIFQVAEWFVEVYESKSSGKELGKVTYMFWETEYKRREVYLWLCLPDNYSGFAVQKAQEKWAQISEDNFPLTVDELGDKKYKAPTHILVDMSGKYPDLVEVVCSDGVVCLNDDQRDDEIPFGADSVDTDVDLSDIPF